MATKTLFRRTLSPTTTTSTRGGAATADDPAVLLSSLFSGKTGLSPSLSGLSPAPTPQAPAPQEPVPFSGSSFFPSTRTSETADKIVPKTLNPKFPSLEDKLTNPKFPGIVTKLPATTPSPAPDTPVLRTTPGGRTPTPPPTREDPVTPSGGALSGEVTPSSILASVQAFGPPSAATLDAWWAANGSQLEALGYRYISHHTDPALVLPGGQEVDLIQNAGTAGAQWQWLFKPGGGGTSGFGGFGSFGGFSGSAPPRTGSGSAIGQIDPTTPSIFPGSQQIAVGQDPLSQLLNASLGDLLETGLGDRGSDLFDEALGLIQRGGDLDDDTQALRFESARELLDRGRRAQTNQIRANLAARNLLSEPGIPQGAELGALTRLEGRLGEDFARALRDIAIEGQQAADTRLAAALATASGLATTEARTILDAIQTGTERQAILSDIALDVLDRNLLWNEFLARFGLERAQTLEILQSGRINDAAAVLDQFQRFVNLVTAGQVAP